MTNRPTVNDCFIPDFCSIKMTFAVVVGAQLLSVVLTIVDFASLTDFWSELSMRSLYIQWIALGSAALLCLVKPLLQRFSGLQSAGLALLLVLLVVLAVTEASHYLVWQGESSHQHELLLLKSLSVSAIITILLLHYFYVQQQLRLQEKAENDARFEALQARIRPHFLFNSMNTIAHLTRTDPRMAERVVEDLSDLFRATLSKHDGANRLADEIELARGYLNIEKMRLGDRLETSFDLDNLPQDALLPALTLQPLLENAVYHGIEPAAAGGFIRLSGILSNDRIEILIVNNAEEHDVGSRRSGNRMALDNIRQRLLSYFDMQAYLETNSGPDQFEVKLTFPYRRQAA